jgi:hypothetical protein
MAANESKKRDFGGSRDEARGGGGGMEIRELMEQFEQDYPHVRKDKEPKT